MLGSKFSIQGIFAILYAIPAKSCIVNMVAHRGMPVSQSIMDCLFIGELFT